MTDLRNKIEKMFKEIEAIEKIDQDYLWTYTTESETDEVIKKVEKEIGRELPESILSFYTNVGELQLQWDYYGDEEIGGKTRIPDLASLFSNKIEFKIYPGVAAATLIKA